MAAFVAKAVETKRPYMGVKGPSLLSFCLALILFVEWCLIICTVCLGVARQMATLWFDGKHHKEPFYIGKATKTTDSRLLSINQCAASQELHDLFYRLNTGKPTSGLHGCCIILACPHSRQAIIGTGHFWLTV